MTDIRLAEIGMQTGQDQLLDALPANGAISISLVAQTLDVRPSTVSKMIDRLTEKDLVCRSLSGTDGRLTLVNLTDAGRSKRTEVHRVWADLEAELTGATPAADGSRMNTLVALEALVSQRLGRLR